MLTGSGRGSCSSNSLPNWRTARISATLAGVTGPASMPRHSCRLLANTTPCGDSSMAAWPLRASRRSSFSISVRATTTPTGSPLRAMAAYTGAAKYRAWSPRARLTAA